MAQSRTQQVQGRSRAATAHKATRPALKARLMLAGPAGAGKTFSGLTIAREIVGPAGRIVVIDTEKESALTYADAFDFDHIAWAPPFDPRDLAATINDLSDAYDAILIDSMSHFWRGEGGTLSIVDSDIRGWKEGTPIQDALVEAILAADAHMLLCVRSKMEYAISQDGSKVKVQKLGMAPVQRDDLEFELNVSLTLDMSHRLSVVKSRSGSVADRTYPAGEAEQFARDYSQWLAGGQPLADKTVRDEVKQLLDGITSKEVRTEAKRSFLAEFGPPGQLLEQDAERALEVVRATVQAAQETPGTPEGTDPTPEPSDGPQEPPAEALAEPQPVDETEPGRVGRAPAEGGPAMTGIPMVTFIPCGHSQPAGDDIPHLGDVARCRTCRRMRVVDTVTVTDDDNLEEDA